MGVHALGLDLDPAGEAHRQQRGRKAEFGYSLALSSDGNTALIGGLGDNSKVGAAWAFTRSGSTWTQHGEKLAGTGESGEGEFGYSLALSSDGNTALIGGQSDGVSVGAAWAFVNQPAPPTVETKAASSMNQTSATLNATVNPNAGEVSECKFEYGTTIAYGSSAPCTSLPGSGEIRVAVSASVTSLAEGTIYHFRIVATNPTGTSYGSDQTFTTGSPGRVYKNGVIGAEGKKLRTIGWGTLKLANSTLGEVECHDVIGGYMENPTGGGAAVDKVQAFVPYECVSESCKTLGGTGIEVTAEKLPWSAEVLDAIRRSCF